MNYPHSLQKVIEGLKLLPGVGDKTAERYAFSLLSLSKQQINELAQSLIDLNLIHECKICHNLCDGEICHICNNENRNTSLCCVVSSSKDLLAIENAGVFNGVYHVLNGVISASKGIYPQDLTIDDLLKRIDTQKIKEIIMATPLTMDGEMTALYIKNKCKLNDVVVTRIARGLPMGGQIDYADSTTLKQAFNGRKQVDDE